MGRLVEAGTNAMTGKSERPCPNYNVRHYVPDDQGRARGIRIVEQHPLVVERMTFVNDHGFRYEVRQVRHGVSNTETLA